MKAHRCCPIESPGRGDAPRPAARWRRGGELASWIISSATLVLLPKCPACVAAYVALFSGVGISISTAAHLRWSLMMVCAASLVLLSLRHLRRVMNWPASLR